jgi:5-methylcytosine-specific restriction endonuclease McrA
MDWETFYLSPDWAALREDVLRRDADRCTVARLLGGDCSSVLHVHHLSRDPRLALDIDNLGTACARHHPMWEAVRRAVQERRPERAARCRHQHRYDSGREACRRARTAA